MTKEEALKLAEQSIKDLIYALAEGRITGDDYQPVELEAFSVLDAIKEALAQPAQEPDRQELQANGTHPAPCARHCEAQAFKVEIRNLKAQLAQPAPPPPECKTEAEQTAYAFGWWKALESVKTKQLAQESVTWRNAAIRLGEELSSVGPDGYYDMTAKQWLDWAMEQEPRGKNSLVQPAQEPLLALFDENQRLRAELKFNTVQQQEPRNFCPRCGKRTADLTVIHTCTPPEGGHQ